MKAKELMCDDLVLFHGNIYKVFGIFGKADCVSLFPIHTRNAEGLILGPIDCFAKDIEPIPLTPEILEKNGWNMYGCPDHKCWGHYLDASEYGSQYVPFSICLFDFMNKGSMYGDDFYEQIIIHVRFVHELQRALRCCELWDLADNFIIDS